METCGLICVSGDYEKFLMRCSHCPTDVEVAQWQEFVLHIRNMHSNVGLTEDEIIESEKAVDEGDVDSVELESAEENQSEEEDEVNGEEEESEGEANEAVEREAVGSSMDATEYSNPSEASDFEESDEEEEPRKFPFKKENAPAYKVSPLVINVNALN